MMTSACGFHFRGSYLLPDEVSTISVSSFDSYSQITRDVKNQLRFNGVDVVPPASDVPNLYLISESDSDNSSDRTLSLYQNSRAAEKELRYVVSYRVTVPGYDPKTFRVNITRSYLDNPLAALAKSVERDMLWDEMREQAAEQIIRQMARLKAQLAVTPSENNEMQDFPTDVDTQTETTDLGDGVQQTITTDEVSADSKDSSATASETETP
nr:LPS assembly lipoprotein LptE [Vibrio gangliei]